MARNIAEATSRATTTAYPGIESLLVSPVGEDLFGHILAGEITRLGMRNDGLIVVPKRTAVCNMVLDSEGALVGGVADMDITTDISPELASLSSSDSHLEPRTNLKLSGRVKPSQTLAQTRCIRWQSPREHHTGVSTALHHE